MSNIAQRTTADPLLRRLLRLLALWVTLIASLVGVGTATAVSPAGPPQGAPAARTAEAAHPADAGPAHASGPAHAPGTARASDTAAAARPGRSLVGVWDLTVTVGTGSDAAVTEPRFFFHADHRLTAEGPPDGSGQPEYLATGFWNARPDGSFAFYVTHPGGPEASHPGTIQGVHIGRITGRTFTTRAVAFTTDDATGQVDGPITVRSRGRWVPASR